ncbi:MAG TPA: ABC transporter ATP-binding protein [Candidatus Aminicenantes bacterium]|nr:ABC transporter ATP-binding protein [Candidatus Aminicenantes bacterium]
MAPVIEAETLSKWYGNILGVSDISLRLMPGVHGLLGPNGAGKTTFLRLATGQLKPNRGRIRIFGEPVFNNPGLFQRVGFCPENDAYYRGVSGGDYLAFLARLHGASMEKARDQAREALHQVGLEEVADKAVSAYSLGMRQRLKVSAAVLHDPQLVILDEPLKGVDPLWRARITDLIRDFASRGRTVIVSSHVLPEIEAMTNNIVLIHQGEILAEGDIQEIRGLLDSHPHMISVRTPQFRLIAEWFVEDHHVLTIRFDNARQKVVFKTDNRDHFFGRLNRFVVENNLEIEEITSPDDNLQAVFNYLVGRK